MKHAQPLGHLPHYELLYRDYRGDRPIRDLQLKNDNNICRYNSRHNMFYVYAYAQYYILCIYTYIHTCICCALHSCMHMHTFIAHY